MLVVLFCVASVPQYLSKFQWDFAKYATKQSLKSIGDMIAKVNCISYCLFLLVIYQQLMVLNVFKTCLCGHTSVTLLL